MSQKGSFKGRVVRYLKEKFPSFVSVAQYFGEDWSRSPGAAASSADSSSAVCNSSIVHTHYFVVVRLYYHSVLRLLFTNESI